MAEDGAGEVSAEWRGAVRTARVRNGFVVLLLSVITIGIYAIGWLYRLQQEHPRRHRIDPPAGLWLGMFIGLTFLMLFAFAASGYGVWTDWSDAETGQRRIFLVALAIAVLFNLWFGLGAMRLTDRFHHLLHREPGTLRTTIQKVLLSIGVVCEMVAMIVPPAVEVGLVYVPDEVDLLLRITGSLGTGSLLAWAIELHRQANEVAGDVRSQEEP